MIRGDRPSHVQGDEQGDDCPDNRGDAACEAEREQPPPVRAAPVIVVSAHQGGHQDYKEKYY